MFSIAVNLAYASFFNSLFRHKHSKHKVVYLDYTDDEAAFKQYCNIESKVYGYKIVCTKSSPIVSFKPDASATVRCAQMVNGIGSNYPDAVNLDSGYIKTLADCTGQVYGPYNLQKAKINSSGSANTSLHQTITYYDLVCDGQGGYDNKYYQNIQKLTTDSNNQKIQQCIVQNTGTAKTFIILFEICIGLAAFAFGIFIYKNYYKKKKIGK